MTCSASKSERPSRYLGASIKRKSAKEGASFIVLLHNSGSVRIKSSGSFPVVILATLKISNAGDFCINAFLLCFLFAMTAFCRAKSTRLLYIEVCPALSASMASITVSACINANSTCFVVKEVHMLATTLRNHA